MIRRSGLLNQGNREACLLGEPPRGDFDINSGMAAGHGGRGGFDTCSGIPVGRGGFDTSFGISVGPGNTEIGSGAPVGRGRGRRGGFDTSTSSSGFSTGRGGIDIGSAPLSGHAGLDRFDTNFRLSSRTDGKIGLGAPVGRSRGGRGGFNTSFGMPAGHSGTEISSGTPVGRGGRGGFDTSSTNTQISAGRGSLDISSGPPVGRGRGGVWREGYESRSGSSGVLEKITKFYADLSNFEKSTGLPIPTDADRRDGFDSNSGISADRFSIDIVSGTQSSRGGTEISSGLQAGLGHGGHSGFDINFKGIPPDHTESQLAEGIASGFAQQAIQSLPCTECKTSAANFMRQLGKHFEEIANIIEKQ